VQQPRGHTHPAVAQPVAYQLLAAHAHFADGAHLVAMTLVGVALLTAASMLVELNGGQNLESHAYCADLMAVDLALLTSAA